MTQNEKILNYIKNHGSIDQRRATLELDILRLAARISDLRGLGVPIISETKYRLDEAGKVVSKWAEYRIAPRA
jgi:hypothetical protein